LAPFATAPFAVRLARAVFRTDGRALNDLLFATAKLLFVFGAALAFGIVAANTK
jgi:hypothetical protein